MVTKRLSAARIALITGAGGSPMPTCQELTDSLLCGDHLNLHTDGHWCKIDAPKISFEGVEGQEIQQVLRWIWTEQKGLTGRERSYEEIYNVLASISDEFGASVVSRQYVQHIESQPFFREILLRTNERRSRCQNGTISAVEFLRFGQGYIRDLIKISLRQGARHQHYLRPVKTALVEGKIGSVDIFTLNHDLLTERAMRDLDFCDGFERDDPRCWSPDLFQANSTVRLLKLHGSLNWYWSIDRRRWEQCDLDVQPREDLGFLVIGTQNKFVDYNFHLFGEVMCLFRQMLNNLNVCLASGYSFRDPAVNEILRVWLSRQRSRRLIIFHEHPDTFWAEADHEVRRAADSFPDQIHVVPQHLQAKAKELEDIIDFTDWSRIENLAFSGKV